MLFKVGAYIAVLLTFGAALWWVKSQLDLLQSTQARVVQLEQSLATSRKEVSTLQEQRRVDAEQALGDYQKADWACNSTIKEVVAGNRVKPIILKERIYETTGECPAAEPMYRVRSLQRAGRTPDDLDEDPVSASPAQ
jgi:hypothetical protein